MKTFVKAVITGFGFTLGKTLFDKFKERYLEPREARAANGAEFVDMSGD